MSDKKWGTGGTYWISSTTDSAEYTFNPGTFDQNYKIFLGSHGWSQFEKAFRDYMDYRKKITLNKNIKIL